MVVTWTCYFLRISIFCRTLRSSSAALTSFFFQWGMSIANSWRMSGDVYDSFSRPDPLCSCTDPRDPHCVNPGHQCSVLFILNRVAAYADKGRPGGWNDLDMLEVGLGGMSDEEVRDMNI